MQFSTKDFEHEFEGHETVSRMV